MFFSPVLLKCDETRSGRLETKRRKRFWKQCAIKCWSSQLKALLWVPRDFLGPKNNWVDLWNRSSPSCREESLQCRAPMRPPTLKDFGTPKVPTTPNNTCLHKGGSPLRDLRGCRQHLAPWGLPGTTRGLGWASLPGLQLAYLQDTVIITNAPRA